MMLRVNEVADRLGCSERTVRRRIADGSLRSVRFGGLRLIPEDAVAAITQVVPPDYWMVEKHENNQ